MLKTDMIALLIALGITTGAAIAAPPAFEVDGPPNEDGVYVFTRPEVKLTETAEIALKMKPIAYIPPADALDALPKTRDILTNGGEWRVVMLGDSIVNDMSRSNWSFHLQERVQKLDLLKFTVVRGGTGCQWYKEEGRIPHYVLSLKPALVMIGGISHGDDIEAVRDVVQQIRAASDADILLMTGPFGTLDPQEDVQWKTVVEPAESSYKAGLKRLAQEKNIGFFDLQKAWGEYVRASGQPVDAFKRDAVHANREGEQILGQLLIQHLTARPPSVPDQPTSQSGNPSKSPGTMPVMSQSDLPEELTVEELHKLRQADAPLVLLDCRKQDEYDTARIKGSMLIPMGLIPERLAELEPHKDAHVVVHCHHGGRSLRVTRWLKNQGFTRVQNLTGGIDAWSEKIDPAIPRY